MLRSKRSPEVAHSPFRVFAHERAYSFYSVSLSAVESSNRNASAIIEMDRKHDHANTTISRRDCGGADLWSADRADCCMSFELFLT